MKNLYLLQHDKNGYPFIEISEAESEKLLAQGNKRITVTLADGHVAHVSVKSPKTGGHFVQFSKELARNHGLKEGEKQTFILAIDTSEHQFAMPEEVQLLLDIDDDFREKFMAMRPGARRSLLFWAGYPKNELERAEKSNHLAEMVAAGQQSADLIRKSFKRSDQWMKDVAVKPRKSE